MTLSPIVLFVTADSLTDERPIFNSFPVLVMDTYNDCEFRRHFRVSWDVFNILKSALFTSWNRRSNIDHSILCFLWHIATNSTFRELSSKFRFGETTVQNLMLQIANVVNENLKHYVSFNLSQE